MSCDAGYLMMSKAPVLRLRKEQEWCEHLGRHSTSGWTIAEYAQSAAISADAGTRSIFGALSSRKSARAIYDMAQQILLTYRHCALKHETE